MSSPKIQEHHPAYLDLPLELWHLIYQHLPWSDLIKGALVSSTAVKDPQERLFSPLSLSLYCQSQIWSKVDADDWVYEGLLQGLLRNSSLIRRLSCSPKSHLELLSHQQDCRSITHLDIEKVRFLNTAVLNRILTLNAPCLQSFRVKLDRSIHFQTLVGHLSSMKELRELYLQHWEGITQESIATILETCPQIETLSLGHNSLYPFMLDNLVRQPAVESKDAIDNNNIDVCSPEPLIPFKIRSLILDEAIIFHEELILNLCSRCPDLESLCMQGCFGIRLSEGFITKLAQICPRLTQVNFTNQSTTKDFYRTLFKIFPGLRQVKVTGSILQDEDIQLLVEHSNATLEALDIGYCTCLGSDSILKILMGCPNLTALDARGVDFNPRDMIEPTDEWVCHRAIRSLYLEVLLPKRLHYAVGEIQQIRTRVYEQLSRCTRLVNLQLSAGARDCGVNVLEMSLLTGLEQLADLKQMERLDFKRLNHSVRVSEVNWMLKTWPRLKALGILLDTNADSDVVHAVQKWNRAIILW
ncbi:hypothetical protein CPB97_006550 [Podila verticillata]|nr:hypothetical protein CPB97_006550 [Podila verticillata]